MIEAGPLFTKLLPLFAVPLGLVSMLLVLALFLMLLGARKFAFVITASAFAILIAASLPVTALKLGRPLEHLYPPILAEVAPAADAIVVLGGGVELKREPRLTPEVNGAGDRLLEGARLFHAGRAPVLLVSGGNFYGDAAQAAPESVYAAEILNLLGVDPAAVVVETDSRTTYENAVKSYKFLKKRGIRRVLLVTSAMHMPRAMAVFDSVGIEALAQPTDYRFPAWGEPDIMRYVPQVQALSATTLSLHEYLGFFVYRWRGWISDRYGFLPGVPLPMADLASRQNTSS